MPQYVYLIQDGGLCKIGFSRHPAKRLRKVASKSAELVHYFEYNPGYVGERLWHKHFAANRVIERGEWFRLSEEQIGEFIFVGPEITCACNSGRVILYTVHSANCPIYQNAQRIKKLRAAQP